jgi:CRP-like cAMP-binding protein
MRNEQVDRRAFIRWTAAGQTLLLERDRAGTVYVLPDDGGPEEKRMHELVEALDRGETIELVNSGTGKVLSTMELTDDGYVERLAPGVVVRELDY